MEYQVGESHPIKPDPKPYMEYQAEDSDPVNPDTAPTEVPTNPVEGNELTIWHGIVLFAACVTNTLVNSSEQSIFTSIDILTITFNLPAKILALNFIEAISVAVAGLLAPLVTKALRSYTHLYRQLACVAIVLQAVGLVLPSFSPNAPLLFLGYVLFIAASASILTSLLVCIIAEYFPITHRFHVLATALYTMGQPLSMLVFNAAMSSLVQHTSWRSAWKILGGIVFVVGIPFSLMLRSKPVAESQTKDNIADSHTHSRAGSHVDIRGSADGYSDSLSIHSDSRGHSPPDSRGESFDDNHAINSNVENRDDNRTTDSRDDTRDDVTVWQSVCTFVAVLDWDSANRVAQIQLALWLLVKFLFFGTWFAFRANIHMYMLWSGYLSTDATTYAVLVFAGACLLSAVPLVALDRLRGHLLLMHVLLTVVPLMVCLLLAVRHDINHAGVLIFVGVYGASGMALFSLTFATAAEVTGFELAPVMSVTLMAAGAGVAVSPLYSGLVFDETSSFRPVFYAQLASFALQFALLVAMYVLWNVGPRLGRHKNYEEVE